MKFMRVELGTGYCGEFIVEYYILPNQWQFEVTDEDWDTFLQMAVDWYEHMGRDYQWYLEDIGIEDPENYDYVDDYIISCTEYGHIEIVDDPTMDDGSLVGEW